MSGFDVLGLGPNARPEEIVAAYRRRIRELHPDLAPDASPDERRAREQATAQLNLAYETALAHARRLVPPGGDEEDTRPQFAAAPKALPRRRRVAPYGVLVALLIAVVVMVATWHANSSSGTAIGECVAWHDRPEVVSCAAANDGRIVAIRSSARSCPAQDSVWTIDPRTNACIQLPQ
jgi:hypothetical protein